MEGFSVNCSNQFNITEIGMHPRGFNATLMLGGSGGIPDGKI